MTGSLADKRPLTDGEELANAVTHGLGCVAAAMAAVVVLWKADFSNTASRVGFLVYGGSLVLVLLMSTLSHSIRQPRALHQLRAWDQGTIYLLIAGTYTPGVLAFCDGWFGRYLLVFVWCVALFGFYSKVVSQNRINAVTTVTYLLLGWVPALCLVMSVPRHFFLWLLAGGVCYSIGVVFLINDRRVKFFHAAWHLWVLVAAAVHFYAIYAWAL